MFAEILRIALPVAVDVRSVGIIRVRPEVVRLGVKIVQSPGTARCGESRDRLRRLRNIAGGGRQNPVAIYFSDKAEGVRLVRTAWQTPSQTDRARASSRYRRSQEPSSVDCSRIVHLLQRAPFQD